MPKKEAKICEKKQELIFLPLLYTINIFASINIEQKINVPKILKNTHLDKMMTLTDKMAGKKVFGI